MNDLQEIETFSGLNIDKEIDKIDKVNYYNLGLYHAINDKAENKYYIVTDKGEIVFNSEYSIQVNESITMYLDYENLLKLSERDNQFDFLTYPNGYYYVVRISIRKNNTLAISNIRIINYQSSEIFSIEKLKNFYIVNGRIEKLN